MKRTFALIVVILLAAFAGNYLGNTVAHAQAAAVLQLTGSWSTHTACAPTAGQTTLCIASDGLWISLSGGTFTQLGAASSAGVTSFNGRTGAVVPTANDYTYSQLASPPTTVNCGPTGCAIK